MIKYSIIIATYNNCNNLLKPCLESIVKYTDLSNVEIVIVANGCTDNTREYVESLGEPFRLIWYDEPLGFTKANNIGIRASRGEYVLLLNNDTILLEQPKNQWVNILSEPFINDTQNNVGITGPSMNFDPNSGHYFLIFFCVLIKKEVLKIVGELDEIYNPGFGEDTAWCIEAENLGYMIIQVPTSKKPIHGEGKLMIGDFPIYHQGEGTFGIDDFKYQNIIKRNSEILHNKYYHILPHGAFSDQDINVYKSFVGRVPKGSRIAEVGVWKGKSLCSVADIIKDHDLKVVAVDWFRGTVSENSYKEGETANFSKKVFESSLSRFKLDSRTTIINGDSSDSANLFPDKYFSSVFIDADHSYESVKKDINAWWNKIIPGGILCGHDYLWYGVRQAIEEKFGVESVHTDLCNMWYVDKPMIYDCFMFANELDTLEIRLNELKDIVDKFVIVEATITQSGKLKPLFLKENFSRFESFKDKIIHIIVEDMPQGIDPWERERFQRDAIMRGLVNLKDEDIVIISDVDEIPRAETIKNYRREQGIVSLEQKMSYYYVNCFSLEKWDWVKVLPYKLFKNMTPCQVRYTVNTPKISNGGWHFSFLGGVDKIIEKIEAYAHQEYNNDKIKNKESIIKTIEKGEDIFGRGTKYYVEPIDSSYPLYLRNNPNKFRDIILETKNSPSEFSLPGRETITAIISTKNRYHTTLPLAVMSIINQTHKVNKLIIFDDGEHKDLREDPLWSNIFLTLEAKKIDWEIVYGEGKGQVLNHQKSIDICKTDWIWRMDDDNYAEYNVLEKLLQVADKETGAVGGLVLDPKMKSTSEIASSKIEDIYLGLNKQWFRHEGVSEVDHLYSTFIYRKEASKHGYSKVLSPVGFREETLFTCEMKRNGWKIKINPSAITWHYKNSEGGLRLFKDEKMWAWDDSVLAFKLKEWGIQPRKPKLVVLDAGLGDHLVFKKILPELKAKYKDIIIACCYPLVFEDDLPRMIYEPYVGYKGFNPIKLISIEEAKLMGNILEYNIYAKMTDWRWQDSLESAFRKLYL